MSYGHFVTDMYDNIPMIQEILQRYGCNVIPLSTALIKSPKTYYKLVEWIIKQAIKNEDFATLEQLHHAGLYDARNHYRGKK